jgi:hypothetical protein
VESENGPPPEALADEIDEGAHRPASWGRGAADTWPATFMGLGSLRGAPQPQDATQPSAMLISLTARQ